MDRGFSIRARGGGETDILIYEDIGEIFGGVTAKQFARDLQSVGRSDVINLRISSIGGDINEGLAIYRRLVEHSARIITHIDGWAASIASVIAMAGNEIRISESGAVMIHEAFAARVSGDAEMIRAVADRLDANTSAIADIYAARTKNDVAQLRAWMKEETWFYGQEAVDAGFADKVVANMRIAARYDPAKHVFKNPPKALAERPNLDAFKTRLAQMQAKMARHRAA